MSNAVQTYINEEQSVTNRTEDLFRKICTIIDDGRRYACTAINLSEVYAKYEIGRYIVENEQEGHYRAQYGKRVLERLSLQLTEKYGEGWSYRNLREFKQFYKLYSKETVNNDDRVISEKGEIDLASSVRQMQDIKMASSVRQIQEFVTHKFVLSWSHYLILMRIKNDDERRFYEIESQKQQWSYRQLSRQIGSSLYERLALSRDKAAVMRLTHQDLGQMQMYVNYYDRYVRLPHEKPTIGILICQGKDDSLVELTLPKDANIYAAEYALYLPDKKELQQRLKEWTEEFDTCQIK